jgi:hypothetical protein
MMFATAIVFLCFVEYFPESFRQMHKILGIEAPARSGTI